MSHAGTPAPSCDPRARREVAQDSVRPVDTAPPVRRDASPGDHGPTATPPGRLTKMLDEPIGGPPTLGRAPAEPWRRLDSASRPRGPRDGPPYPPTLGRAPAEPWRASIAHHASEAAMLSKEDNDLITKTGPGTIMGALVRQYLLAPR